MRLKETPELQMREKPGCYQKNSVDIYIGSCVQQERNSGMMQKI
jgi:hypothetical protein